MPIPINESIAIFLLLSGLEIYMRNKKTIKIINMKSPITPQLSNICQYSLNGCNTLSANIVYALSGLCLKYSAGIFVGGFWYPKGHS